MKKLLSILGAAGLIATSSASVVACGSSPSSTGGAIDDNTNDNTNDNMDVAPSDPKDPNDISHTFNLKTVAETKKSANKLTSNPAPLLSPSDFYADATDENTYDLTENAEGGVNYDYQTSLGSYINPLCGKTMYQVVMMNLANMVVPNDTFAKENADGLLARLDHERAVHHAYWDQDGSSTDFYAWADDGVIFNNVIQDYYEGNAPDEMNITVRIDITEAFLSDIGKERNHPYIDQVGWPCKGINVTPGSYFFQLGFYAGISGPDHE